MAGLTRLTSPPLTVAVGVDAGSVRDVGGSGPAERANHYKVVCGRGPCDEGIKDGAELRVYPWVGSEEQIGGSLAQDAGCAPASPAGVAPVDRRGCGYRWRRRAGVRCRRTRGPCGPSGRGRSRGRTGADETAARGAGGLGVSHALPGPWRSRSRSSAPRPGAVPLAVAPSRRRARPVLLAAMTVLVAPPAGEGAPSPPLRTNTTPSRPAAVETKTRYAALSPGMQEVCGT